MAKTKNKTSSKTSKKPKGLGRLHFLQFKHLMAVAVAMVVAAAGLTFTGLSSAAGCKVTPLSITKSDPSPWLTAPSWSACKDVNIGRNSLHTVDGKLFCGRFRTVYENGGGSIKEGVQVCTGQGLKVIDYDIPNNTRFKIIMIEPTSARAWFNAYY